MVHPEDYSWLMSYRIPVGQTSSLSIKDLQDLISKIAGLNKLTKKLTAYNFFMKNLDLLDERKQE